MKEINKKYLAILTISLVVILGISFYIMNFFMTFEYREFSQTNLVVNRKSKNYSYPSFIYNDGEIFIPTTKHGTNYYLILDDNSSVLVSKSVYENHPIGSNFTQSWSKWVKKDSLGEKELD